MIHPGCYYPGCDEDHADGIKWCPTHNAKYGTRQETKTMTETNETKAAPEKAASRKGKGATPAQKAAALKASAFASVNWLQEIAEFRESKKPEARIEMGSPGSAQVTRVRLVQRPDTKGITISTQGAEIVFTKGGKK